MNFIKKILCLHMWTSHAKKDHVDKYYDALFSISTPSKIDNYTHEILICTKCGKIKHIKY